MIQLLHTNNNPNDRKFLFSKMNCRYLLLFGQMPIFAADIWCSCHLWHSSAVFNINVIKCVVPEASLIWEAWRAWTLDVPALGPRWDWPGGPDPLAQRRQGSASSRTLAPAPAAGCCWTWSCSSSAYASSSPPSSTVHLYTPSQRSRISFKRFRSLKSRPWLFLSDVRGVKAP